MILYFGASGTLSYIYVDLDPCRSLSSSLLLVRMTTSGLLALGLQNG